jgi:hypothetical protein
MTRSVSIFADTLKIYTTEDDGIRWNSQVFNYAASDFTEPFLIPLREFQKSAAYHDYLEKIQKIQSVQQSSSGEEEVTIEDGITYGGITISKDITLNKEISYDSFLSEDEFKMLVEESKTSSPQKIEYMKKLIYQGYSYRQAKLKAERDLK